jgi:hypothetical protein
VLLALFLIEAAAGLYLFLPLVGRRNAGVKFYRLILITGGAMAVGATAAHAHARGWEAGAADAGVIVLTLLVWFLLRYPKRLIFRAAAALLALAYLVAAAVAFRSATGAALVWSVAGSLSAISLLGSVTLAMLLGHWYLVVRGMPIDPLKRLTIATLAATGFRAAVVGAALLAMRSGGMEYGSPLYAVLRAEGLFFWMRVGWGLAGPLLLYPMVWGTVKIRSTMAATGILYVDVVAVVIGEVLGCYLAGVVHMPM